MFSRVGMITIKRKSFLKNYQQKLNKCYIYLHSHQNQYVPDLGINCSIVYAVVFFFSRIFEFICTELCFMASHKRLDKRYLRREITMTNLDVTRLLAGITVLFFKPRFRDSQISPCILLYTHISVRDIYYKKKLFLFSLCQNDSLKGYVMFLLLLLLLFIFNAQTFTSTLQN